MLKANNAGLSSRNALLGTRLNIGITSVAPMSRPLCATIFADNLYDERFRLHNLSPQTGSKKKRTRKGRGYSAGQGGSCGFGMRGQKSRSGSGPRPGFEGGQTPLYRRLPKLRGIAGGMPAGRQKYVTINVSTLARNFDEGEVVDLETLKEKGIISATGKERKMPLKVLGDGKLEKSLEVKAAVFSEAAKQKIEAAGGTPVEIPQKPKWTQKLYDQRVAEGIIIPRKTKRYYYLQSKVAAEDIAAIKEASSDEN